MSEPFTLVENQIRVIDFLGTTKLADLDQYLDEVWQSRTLSDNVFEAENSSIKQPFLIFGQNLKTGESTIKAGKYVGFIQYEGVTIQIIPKLFELDQAKQAFKHLLWWLDYCKRVRFPFTDLLSDVESISDFSEALISYFARFTHQLVSSLPYHQYEETTEILPYVRGRLNTQQYINTSLSRGNWHQLVCDYEPFVFNNRLNQIIKHVARKLTYLCRFSETHRVLERLIFVLDEVDDFPATVQDCDSLRLNRFYQDYEACLAMCRFFLADSYLTRPEAYQRNFCFLVPMDYIYEDFIAGVIERHFNTFFRKIIVQATKWLTEQKVFQIRNDLLLTYRNASKLIVDMKYKLRNYQSTDRKAGVNQTDLYQMISYALRQSTQQVVLLYPLKYSQQQGDEQEFTVASNLLGNHTINIKAVELTITGESKQAMIDTLQIELTKAFDLPVYEIESYGSKGLNVL